MKLAFIIYLVVESSLPVQYFPISTNSPDRQFVDCIENDRLNLSEHNVETVLYQWAKNLQKETCFTPAGAFDFIEIMNDYGVQSYHRIAEQFYFKALNTSSSSDYFLLEKEAQKIIPLLLPLHQKQWENKIKTQDFSLATDILQFWNQCDPVLTTPINERLSEHWERIAYARKHFTRNTGSVYKTDDRGLIYVRFGEPTDKRKGLLMPEPTDIRARLYDISANKGGLTPQEIFNLNISIRQQYTPQPYEIWVYENLSPLQRVLYLFGRSANSGSYGLRTSVEDFISTSSFSKGISSSWRYNTGSQGLTAGPFLQTALYNTLSTIDTYFGQQLLYYDNTWDDYFSGNVNFTSLKIHNNQTRAETALRRIQARAPGTYSTWKHNLGYLDHSYLTYRFLDDDFKPIHRILVFTQPGEKLLEFDRKRIPDQQAEYRIDQILKISGTPPHVSSYYHKLSPVVYEPEHTGYLLQIPDSVFDNSFGIIQIGSEVKRYTPARDTGRMHVTIIASKVSDFVRPAPLESNNIPFSVSDLVWGFNPATKNHDIEAIPFAVLPDSIIPPGTNLTIYFETYHTGSSSDDLYTYQLSYEIKRIEKQALVDRGIKLSLPFESRTPKTAQTIEINTSGLEPGYYRGFFRFGKAWLPPSKWIERTIDFTVSK